MAQGSDEKFTSFITTKKQHQTLENRRNKLETWILSVAIYAIDRIGSSTGSPNLKELEPHLNFCKDHPPEREHVDRLCLHFHRKCRSHYQDFLDKKVLPSLRDKRDESLLSEFVERWSNHKDIFKWLSQFLNCLNPNSIPLPPVLPLNKVGVSCFRDQVFHEFREDVTKTVLSLIHREREGEQIDQAWLKIVPDIFVEIGLGLEYYETYFEASILKNTELYYKAMAPIWISRFNRSYYVEKAEECLKREKDIVGHYLHSSSEPKLLKIVRHELLTVHATQLLENEHPGDKVKYLMTMHSLFPEEPDHEIVKQRIIDEVTTLKQAEDAASNKKALKEATLAKKNQFH